jgi:hypothetical protein
MSGFSEVSYQLSAVAGAAVADYGARDSCLLITED